MASDRRKCVQRDCTRCALLIGNYHSCRVCQGHLHAWGGKATGDSLRLCGKFERANPNADDGRNEQVPSGAVIDCPPSHSDLMNEITVRTNPANKPANLTAMSKTAEKRNFLQRQLEWGVGNAVSGGRKQRRRLNIDEQLEVAKLLRAGTSQSTLMLTFGVGRRTLSEIKNREASLQQLRESDGRAGQRKSSHRSRWLVLEGKLLKFIQTAQSVNLAATRDLLRVRELSVRSKLLQGELGDDCYGDHLTHCLHGGLRTRLHDRQVVLLAQHLQKSARPPPIEQSHELSHARPDIHAMGMLQLAGQRSLARPGR